MTNLLIAIGLTGSGITAGVMICVCISLIPAFAALPYPEYVRAHRLFGRYFDRVMPPVVLTSLLCLLVADIRSPSPAPVLATVLLAGVSVVSQFGNVPINHRVKSGQTTVERDPRPAWRGFHLTRTAFAIASFVVLCGYSVTG